MPAHHVIDMASNPEIETGAGAAGATRAGMPGSIGLDGTCGAGSAVMESRMPTATLSLLGLESRLNGLHLAGTEIGTIRIIAMATQTE
jgi:hypothetical protein